ncbi:MAG: hypothetical protein GVY30_09975 [Chloroflexi bacterium]|jgi:predicted AlkP superfamily phosphohydrolase/phosphomutase|nr:hypothetical protein [Chloroflexota bacterium]
MQTLIIGLDAFDPKMFERLSAEGQLPNLTQYAEAGGYSPFEIANPPQSEVSWTSIATGLNPGQHGIFDFVHRDPSSYTPYVSLLQIKSDMLGKRFIPPHTATTIFEEATNQGYPATVLWWPATFPARPELPVRTVPGLGTPDIQGRLGVGTLFTTATEAAAEVEKTAVAALTSCGADCFEGALQGPAKEKKGEAQHVELPLHLEMRDEKTAQLTLGKHEERLRVGEWSQIIELTFKMGWFAKVRAITRVILTQVTPEVRLYVMPLQIDPNHPTWRYASPGGFPKQLWKEVGPFLTLGMPQDTTALEDGCINSEQFLALCESIFETRERILMYLLESFEEGLLASVFDTLDRIQHIYWRDQREVVEAWYIKLDALVGRISQRLIELGQEKTNVVILSDHGIAEFRHKVHLNRWLIDHGYLAPKAGTTTATGALDDIDWTKSRLYALGLNGVYVNQEGREAQGIVSPEERDALLDEVKAALSAWLGPDKQRVISGAWTQAEAFEGPLAEYGPDLIVGYAPGFRASAETGLGKWESDALVTNIDHWGADHCIDYRAVPGVIFTNQDLSQYSNLSYRDIPDLTIGTKPTQKVPRPPQTLDKEDQKTVEERLKGLGYL